MAALSYLRGAGLIVEAVAGRLRVSPVERITPELRQYIATHKAELLATLDDSPKRAAWRIILGGQPVGHMVGAPCTQAEALAAVRWRWPDARLE